MNALTNDHAPSPAPALTGPGLIVVPATPELLMAVSSAGIPRAMLADLRRAAPEICKEYAQVGLIGGRPVMAAGVAVKWRGRDPWGRPCGYGEAWARVGFGAAAPSRRYWPEITRRVIDGLDRAAAAGIRLIEATVDAEFHAGHRWMGRLGFEFACPRPNYGPTGRDAIMYRRVRRAG